MSGKPHRKPAGEMRQSQLITTFGPGALLDLPRFSVIVGGLDTWNAGPGGRDEVIETRLRDKVRMILANPDIRLVAPPVSDDEQEHAGITVYKFPKWFVARSDTHTGETRRRALVHQDALQKNGYVPEGGGKSLPVVPVRFVKACRKGHISDIDWFHFVHSGAGEGCRTSGKKLWIEERGTSGDLAEMYVICDCKVERAMVAGMDIEAHPFPPCKGDRPWLGPYGKDDRCGEPSRLLVRTASNAYFPQIMRVISLPTANAELKKAVAEQWEHLQEITEVAELKMLKKLSKQLREALGDFDEADLVAEIRGRNLGHVEADKPVKVAEFEVLASRAPEEGKEQPNGDYFARQLSLGEHADLPWMLPVDRVVLIHRLREVSALLGFTRFESAGPDQQGDLEIGVVRAALASSASWVPATEIRGEGFFIQFKPELIRAWLDLPAVKERGLALHYGFNQWLKDHKASSLKFPGLAYVLLHSLSHLLITSVSLECGYPASSIRERIYVGDYGYGILLYTGSVDAEGTLGGLVEVGRKIHEHLHSALEWGMLCSNDPVCAQHAPDDAHERRFLHGAACHGCLLVAETSCETFNDFLDRSLVVPTVDNPNAAFFGQGLA